MYHVAMKLIELAKYSVFIIVTAALATTIHAQERDGTSPQRAQPTAQPQTMQRQAAPQAQPMEMRPAEPQMSSRQMMQRLQPRAAPARMVKPAADSGSQQKVAKPQPPSKYEIADCGTASSPAICCNYKKGDGGSSCNMFKMLCTNAGGTAQGGSGEAMCTDW